ncbi:hypothetical protein ACSQ67_024874 [Phaseolus vulgaris]
MEMVKGNEVKVGGGGELTVPYDVELLKVVESVGCLDSAEIMMARCMAIIHHWKGVVAESAQTSVKVQELERQVQDLLKDKSETEKTLQAQSLAITHLTANLSLLQKEIEAAKTLQASSYKPLVF